MSKALRNRRRKIDDAKLKELWQSRKTEMEIGEIMGHDPSTLRRRAIKIGLPSSRREIWKNQTCLSGYHPRRLPTEFRPCTCGHAIEEHGHDPKYPGSTACTECDCIAYDADPEADDA